MCIAPGAFDAEHVEFSFDLSEDEIGPPRHDGDINTSWPQEVPNAKKPTEGRRKLVEFDAQTWHALHLLSRESKKTFHELADEAFRDPLQKYARPPI
jgi:hypothetical protein